MRNQIYESAVMFCAGIAFTTGRFIFLKVKKSLFKRRASAFFGEMLFWAAAGLVTSEFLYYAAYGEISFHSFCAFVFGVGISHLGSRQQAARHSTSR